MNAKATPFQPGQGAHAFTTADQALNDMMAASDAMMSVAAAQTEAELPKN